MAVHGLDHIIYATPDLDAAMAEVEERTGVRPVYGGSHTGRGTRNALFSLGADTYIEILAPDPTQPPEAQALAGVRIPATPRITTWAAKCDDLEAAHARAAAVGLDMGPIEDMQRERPDADVLRWRLTRRHDLPGDGLVPFIIDWGDSDHPAPAAPAGCSLLSFRAEHPDPDTVRAYLEALDLANVLPVSRGDAPRLIATLATPRGEVELS